MWDIRAMIDSRQGKKPASSIMAITTGSATTTSTIKGGTRGPTSHSTIKMEVTILTLSIQPSIKDLVFGQARINGSLNKKLAANEKVLENLNSTIESLTSSMKNQLSFNKMIETQLAQLVASLPSSESGGIPEQPEPTREHVSAISTRWVKPSRGDVCS
jgi:hypothetical protein